MVYNAEDLHGFMSFTQAKTLKWLDEQTNAKDKLIQELKKENEKLKKENASLSQQNAVLAALVRATTGIEYKSDYE